MKKSVVTKISDLLFSYWTTLLLLLILGVGAAVATFIENDYGTSTARIVVYNHLWYEIVLVLTTVNLIGIIYKVKMWRGDKARFIFHFSFVVMLIGAAMTRYVGFEGIMHIREGKTEDRMISLEPYLQVTITHGGKEYYKEYQFDLSALGNDFDYNIEFDNKTLNIKYLDYVYSKKGQGEMGILKANATLEGQTKPLKLVGRRGMKGYGQAVAFDDNTNVYVEYGSKTITLPFSIKLNDFQLERYPGSMSPSSYASEVTLIDEKNSKKFDYRIFMNNTLKYGSYQFFQSSYDQDELGTILSVNNDPGKWPTYLGYFLLTLGLLMNLFDKKSRFIKLTQYLKQFNSVMLIIVASLVLSSDVKANQLNTKETLVGYLNEFKQSSKTTAKKFGALVTQSSMGRMKPVNSLNIEIVQKLTKKSSMYGMNADQIVLGMLTRPEMWRHVKMIKVSTPKLKKLLGIDLSQKYIAFSEVFDKDSYKLQKYVKDANVLKPQERGTFEKDILRVDERLNIAYMVYYGNLFRIFPMADDGHEHDLNNKWFNPLDAMEQFHDRDKKAVEGMVRGFVNSVATGKYNEADKFIDLIATYQKKAGAKVIPTESQINNEILFNNMQIFPRLTLAYVILGIILFLIAFATVFNKKWISKKLNMIIFVLLAILFTIHTFGMGMRWYVSGHAPWSDTYESLLYIAWSAMLAGVAFFRKSLLALSATVVMAGIFMFTAHLSGIDPQITNLVPVLKSYWLTIHVSIITGSYGFLGLGAVLGFMSLLLFVFRDPKKKHIDQSIYQMTAINEAALIVGLSFLVVGNFIGGVWANESWGRYWGWDPKETWAYVSIVVYIFVLHLRLIKKLDTPFVFSAVSLVSFGSILMTYFGVNFYLSGMHSYATGDPVPIPTWVYVLTAMIFVLIAAASRKRDLPRLKTNERFEIK